MNPRITLIGAGSVEFTRILLADLSDFPELTEATVVLHDIDPERLATAQQIADATMRATGARFTVEAHLDRRAALDGADFVINEIQVGGFDATLRDFEIPKRFGLRQTIADTLGVGGVFRALRTIPVVLAIADDMDEMCPEAILLNYTNPMAMLCWSVWASGRDTRIVGLCHSVQNTHEQIAEIVGVPEPEIEYLTAGVNHQAWVLRFERDGESLYPLLDEAIARDPDGLARRVRVELYRQFGHFPTESSEHSAEYLPWFMSHDDQLDRYRIPVDEYIRRSQDNLREYAEIKRKLAAGEPLEVLREGELAPRYIHAMATGAERIEYGNVRNDGLIENLPARLLRRGALPGRRRRGAPDRRRRPAPAVRGAQPHDGQRRRPDGAGRPGGPPRPRLPGGDARPQRRGDADDRPDPRDGRRAHRGPRGPAPRGHPRGRPGGREGLTRGPERD